MLGDGEREKKVRETGSSEGNQQPRRNQETEKTIDLIMDLRTLELNWINAA